MFDLLFCCRRKYVQDHVDGVAVGTRKTFLCSQPLLFCVVATRCLPIVCSLKSLHTCACSGKLIFYVHRGFRMTWYTRNFRVSFCSWKPWRVPHSVGLWFSSW